MLRTRSSGWRYSPLPVTLLAVAALHAPAHAGFTTYSIGGNTTAASIQPTIDLFTADIGGANNGNAAGPLAGGRREINWDGGGSGVSAAAGTPFNGFQNTRGASFTTPGTGFLQTPLGDAAFTALNPTYTTTFGVFSPQRIFTPLGSNVTDARFFLPGSGGAIPATVSAFGAVFSDVDVANLTTIQFFDEDDNPIQTFPVPPQSPGSTAPNGGLSFFGAVADAGERIARVRITTGNSALGPNDQNGDNNDIVVMDDFLFDEPVAIPEPATIALTALAMAALLVQRRRTIR
jgi:hypothetical protein